MPRRRAATARDMVDEVKVRLVEMIAKEIDRTAREQVLREAGPVLESLEAKARELGPVGKPWTDQVARLLRRLRRRVRPRGR